MKRLAVIGSRTWPVSKRVFDVLSKTKQNQVLREGAERVKIRVLKALRPGDVVVSGAARGPDTWGVAAARAVGHDTDEIPADWDTLGKGAGFARNTTIAERADGVLAFWDGESRGTRDTMDKASAMGKPVVVVYGDGFEELWNRERVR